MKTTAEQRKDMKMTERPDAYRKVRSEYYLSLEQYQENYRKNAEKIREKELAAQRCLDNMLAEYLKITETLKKAIENRDMMKIIGCQLKLNKLDFSAQARACIMFNEKHVLEMEKSTSSYEKMMEEQIHFETHGVKPQTSRLFPAITNDNE